MVEVQPPPVCRRFVPLQSTQRHLQRISTDWIVSAHIGSRLDIEFDTHDREMVKVDSA